jgi:signal recognition particle subunit SRP54
MFQSLSQNFSRIFNKIKGSGAISQADVDSAIRDIRIALLEGDVALPVVRAFLTNVQAKIQGQEVIKSVLPDQMIVKIIHDEIVNILAQSDAETQLNIQSAPPVNILLVGLQGSGKTTASSKLALKLKNQNKKVLLVSLDIYRPAAQEQLAILAKAIAVDSLAIIAQENVIEITNRALKEAKLGGYDVVIYDSAGRLHIDTAMIQEMVSVKQLVKPSDTLLVVDAMIGQDAVNIAKSFDEQINISGVILSRIDGDSRGGAALSIRYTTGKPIKLLSTGEKPQELEYFDPKRIASRILDMGDIVTLVEKASSLIDKQEMEQTALKLKKGKFDLNDYIQQLRTIKKLGGLSSIISMIPGLNKITNKLPAQAEKNNKLLTVQEAIFFAMTKKERSNPDILNASRRKRIALGSGTSIQQVNILLKQFKQIHNMVKKVNKNPDLMTKKGISNLFS